ncbi:serine hydrolase domain-containing protein [Sphingomonas colocasiae]|uniref:Beta-lactamase family protein n=1 Tax=Sphingomonas colocasiae TaxID=1848973 RepID=A0ABS7PW36_9SPHN|nr:serine hydrolase domain-containing protein [Sphingomonas colocasiae]MBY8825580.1 beta-lactamase family protein [Sphingomonas colocasiae]
MDLLTIDSPDDVRAGGFYDRRYEAVAGAFLSNFRARGEVGAAVCVYEGGVPVVDLWGGMADPATGRPWAADTLVCMMSVGKALAALCLLRLVDRGAVALDRPVADYWPGFGQAGKQSITVAQILDGLASLVWIDEAPDGSLMDWEQMVAAIERQSPNWPPGTAGAYHSMSAGFLFGELVRRVDGRDIGTFFREEIALPLGMDYRFGVTAEMSGRIAPLLPSNESATLNALADVNTPLGRAWRPQPAVEDFFNSPAFREGLFPSANGHGNARGVARLYAAFANHGEIDGVRILSAGLTGRLSDAAWHADCALTGREFAYGLGFFQNLPQPAIMGPSARSFGHPGAGGAIGFADPEHNLAFAYSPNKMCGGASIGDRCSALIAAVYS